MGPILTQGFFSSSSSAISTFSSRVCFSSSGDSVAGFTLKMFLHRQ